MRALIKLSFTLMLISVLTVMVAVWFALSDVPLVTGHVQLSHQDISRARNILLRNDPRRIPPGSNHVIELGAQDLNLAANYLLQKFAHGNANLDLTTDLLHAQASLRVPRLPWRNIVNIDTVIETRDGQPEISGLQLGSLPIPGHLATTAAQWLLDRAYAEAGLNEAGKIEQLRLLPGLLRLTYRWHPALLDQARQTLFRSSDLEALRSYHDELVKLQALGVGTTGPLIDLLQPLFSTALARSVERDPIEENTALLTVLGTWAGRQDLSKLIPDSPHRPSSFRLKIQRRKDFAQHFLTSAALAARGDTALSDAIGLFKEISDTDHGSGFSFTDIAADRAGARFGEFATRSEEHARRVQQRFAAGVEETDFMPHARDLPEHIRTEAFKQQFGYVGSPEYQKIIDEINRRISTCNLYSE
jgi:hypothetical protein